MRRKRARTPADRVRGAVRAELQAQLASLLAATSELPDGAVGTVLDDLAIRSLHGYGLSLSLHVRHPQEPGMVPEDPSVTDALATSPSPLILPT